MNNEFVLAEYMVKSDLRILSCILIVNTVSKCQKIGMVWSGRFELLEPLQISLTPGSGYFIKR